MRSRIFLTLVALCLPLLRVGAAIRLAPDGYHVFPGDEIQDALQLAAANPTNKVVQVHPGEYRPSGKRQAMIYFNKQHDGIQLLACGAVTLTAANNQLSFPSDPGFPAVVNHVIYFGDGVSTNTLLKGFRITGANHFVTKEHTQAMEPNRTIPRNYFFYSDGGAIKCFGRSYPTLENLEIAENYASPCGGGISIQHQGYTQDSVLIQDCVFRANRAEGTGAAVDLLAGSAARIVNCLFVGNTSNTGEDPVAKNSGERPFVNNGVLTIFWKSWAFVARCTFTGNRNGVDDMGGGSTYADCIFVENRLDGGPTGLARYELAVNAGAKVSGCFIRGSIHDVRQAVSATNNVLAAPLPAFTPEYIPQAPEYKSAGYRPVAHSISAPP